MELINVVYFVYLIIALFMLIALFLFITKLPVILKNQSETVELLKSILQEAKKDKPKI